MREKEPRGGIERKILTSILWVAVTPLALALIIGYTFARGATEHATQQDLSFKAYRTAQGLELALAARLDTINILAHFPSVKQFLVAHKQGKSLSQADFVKEIHPESEEADDPFAAIALYDEQGNLLVCTRELPEGPSEDIQTLRTERRSSGRFRRVDFMKAGQQVVGRLAAPVYEGEDGPLLGYVAKTESLDSLLRFALLQDTNEADNFKKTETYQIGFGLHGSTRDLAMAYFDKNSPNGPAIRQEAADPDLLDIMLEDPDRISGFTHLKHYRSGPARIDAHIAYRKVAGFRSIYILVYRPVSKVFHSANLGALLAFLGSAIVIPFFCIIAYRNVHDDIVRPLALVNEGAQIIRQGDLDLKLKIGTGDEIEELALSFNKMALALKRNIRQLAESEERYRSLITSMRDGIYQTDPNDVITFMNPAGLDIFGYSDLDDIAGKSVWAQFLKKADKQRIAAELAENSFVERVRTWMARRDGRAICVELSVNRVFDDEGNFVGEEGIFRDVTKSVQLEQEAQERSGRMRVINKIANVINSSLEAGRLYESIAAEVKKLVGFDYAAVALLTEAGDAFNTRQLWPEPDAGGLVPRQDDENSCAAWVARENNALIVDDLTAADAPFSGQFPENIRSCLCIPLYATERIIGTLNLGAQQPTAFSDRHIEVLSEMAPHVAVAIRNAQLLENLQSSLEEVTKAREKLHQANEELKTLDETKTNLLSNVSHELRTPLVSVMGYTDMIINEKAGPVTETQREYLSISLRNVEKLVTLIENLLDFSRLHRGISELAFDTFDLADCARTSMQIIKPVADGRNIELVLAAPDEPVYVEAEKGKIGQVFNNLLSNAVKFNQNGGKVTIELGRGAGFDPPMGGTPGYVDVSVSDTGIGIPQEALDKVFSRFYQVDDSSTRKYGGTGIGLAIAQDIVRLHGSRITVASDVGKGSVFRFSLPLARQREQEDHAPKPLDPVRPTETHRLIELVTEDRALTKEIDAFLEPEGVDVIHASQADYAVALMHKHKPDCVILDGLLAGGDESVLAPIHKGSAEAEIPLILVADSQVRDAYRGKAAAFVERGFRKTALLRAIQYALGQSAEDALRGSKVLCVDDDDEILDFMRRCLEGEGYEVESCPTGEQAIERARKHDFGLVLLDIAMPGIDGWETCRRIKSDPAFTGLKVCLVTAKPVDSTVPHIKECGADGYLLKPFKPEELAELVHEFTSLVPVREA